MAKVLKVEGMGNGTPEEKRKKHLKLLLIPAVIAAVLILLNSPLFSLKNITVEGNERVTDEEILSDLGLSPGVNLFRYALSHVNSTPRVDSRLTTVDVYMQWPDGVRVVVEESQTIGYVYFQGTYLCIDRKGQVASTTDEPDDDLPVISGLEVGSFSIGDSLNTKDAEKYNAVVTIGTDLRKYNLSTTVREINVRSLDDLIMKTDTLTIYCGSMQDIEQKINVIASLLEQQSLPSGYLHIESMEDQIYLVTEDGTSTNVDVEEDSAGEGTTEEGTPAEEDGSEGTDAGN